MTQTEVLKSAIEFAEFCLEELDLSYMASNQAKRLIEKSKEALAQQSNISELKEKTANHNVDCLCADCSMLDDLEDATAQPEQQEPCEYMLEATCTKCGATESGVLKFTAQPQRKPLLIGKESTEFAKWFNAVWLGDGEQGETIPTSGKEYDEYLSQYTLAFGAWMAAKEAAHGIKE